MSARIDRETERDKLLPTPADPTMRYIDRDERGRELWRVNIRCFHDRESTLSNTKNFQHGSKGLDETYEDLDKLVEDVYLSRPPPRISVDDLDKQKFFIAHSATTQYDLVGSIKPSEHFVKRLQKKAPRAGLTPEKIQDELHTQHVFLKNGIHAKFNTEDGVVDLRDTTSGSWDRESDHLQMAQRIAPAPEGEADPKAPSDYYTGRPDTPEKAREMAEMVFFGELEASQKGLTRDVESGVYTLRIVVNSLESAASLYALGRPFGKKNKGGVEQEQEYFASERRALKGLREDGAMEFIHPKTGETYLVKVEPILFATQVNVIARAEKTLSSAVSGEETALEVSREGWKTLKSYAKERLRELREERGDYDRRSQERREITNKINRIEKLIKLLDESIDGRWGIRKDPEEELFYFIMLTRLLDLPHLVHCKSSTDRTSFAILATTLRQWENMGLPIPADITSLLDDEDFKELFAANWEARHAVTRSARAPHGVIKERDAITGEERERILDHEKIGLAMNHGVTQNVMPIRLLPDRYLKDYGLWQGFKDIGTQVIKGLWNLGKTLIATKPKEFAEWMYKKSGNVPVWSHFWYAVGGLVAVVLGIGAYVAAIGLGIAGIFARGVLEVGYPYAPDLPFGFTVPKGKKMRIAKTIACTLLVLCYRFLEYALPLNSNYWYGTVKPPFENRFGKWLAGLFIGPFVMLKRMVINPLLAYRMIPDKVIDEDKPFIRDRRLIAGGAHQKKFEEANTVVPSDARSLYDYNVKFRERFVNSVRPVREIVYADVVQKTIEEYQSKCGGDQADLQDTIFHEFFKDLDRGMKYTIDGRVFENDDKEALAYEIYYYLIERSKDEHGEPDLEKVFRCLACCQAGTAEIGFRRSQKMLNWPKGLMSDDIENAVRIRNSDAKPTKDIAIKTTGGDWTFKMTNEYQLKREVDDESHANIQITTHINLASGQADLAWKVHPLEEGNPRKFISFRPPVPRMRDDE